MIPQSNGTLTKVTGGGLSEDFRDDGEAGGGPEKWIGNARVYYREKRSQRQTTQGLDVVVERQLIVETRNPSIAYAAGDNLTWTPDDDVEQVDEIREILRRRYRAVAGTGVETTVLTLEAR